MVLPPGLYQCWSLPVPGRRCPDRRIWIGQVSFSSFESKLGKEAATFQLKIEWRVLATTLQSIPARQIYKIFMLSDKESR